MAQLNDLLVLGNSNLLGALNVFGKIIGSLEGNADTATKLKTPVKINGTDFDGSANITTNAWGTSRAIKIADASKTNVGTSVGADGSEDIQLLLPSTIKATLSGNASTASKFNSARTITLTGDVTGSASSDGASGWSIDTTVANDSHEHSIYVLKTGDTMTGTLIMKPAGSGNAGGKIQLAAAQEATTKAGTTIDNYNSTLRIYGINSADGTTKKDGKTLTINPYGATVSGDYSYSGVKFIVNKDGGFYFDNGSYTDKRAIWFAEGDNNAAAMIIGAGGLLVIGGGESATNFYNLKDGDGNPLTAVTQESTYITADDNIYFYTKCNTIGNRLGVILDTSRKFYPLATGTDTKGDYGSLGTSSFRWGSGYIAAIYGDGIGTKSSPWSTGFVKAMTVTSLQPDTFGVTNATTTIGTASTPFAKGYFTTLSNGTVNYATVTDVDNAIAALVDEAPAALDTLKELADALNNDGSFAANVIALIGGVREDLTSHTSSKNNPHEVTAAQVKAVKLSGDTMTGNLTMVGSNPYVAFAKDSSSTTKGYVQYLASNNTMGFGFGIAKSLVIDTTGNVTFVSGATVTPRENKKGSIGTSSYQWKDMYASTFHGELDGVANSALILQNPQDIEISGDVVGKFEKFDGSAKAAITVTRRRASVGQSSSTTTNPWYKVASISLTTNYADQEIVFKVNTGFSLNTASGILRAHVRTNNDKKVESAHLYWEYANSGIDPDKFVLVYPTTASPTIELWAKVDVAYMGYHFDVLAEHSRTGADQKWTLYNTWAAGSTASLDSAKTQLKSSYLTTSNTANKATNDSDGNPINTTYLKRSGGTMTGNIVFDTGGTAECVSVYKTNRKTSGSTNGWAYCPVTFKGADDKAFAYFGAFGSGDALTHLYIGTGEYNATNNLRIAPSGLVTANTLKVESTSTFTGDMTVKADMYLKHPSSRYFEIYFQNNAGATVGKIQHDVGNATTMQTSQFSFWEYSAQKTNDATMTDYYERYNLPASTDGLTESKTYSILTTKSTVTVAQGGTGNNSMTSNRLVWTETPSGGSVRMTAGYHYASSTQVGIGYTSAPGTYLFGVNGITGLAGHLYLTGAAASSSTSNTSQIVFGTNNNVHVAISSNTGAVIINPSLSGTDSQVVLSTAGTSKIQKGLQVSVSGSADAVALEVTGKATISNTLTVNNNIYTTGTLYVGNPTTDTTSPGVGIKVHDLRKVTPTPGMFGAQQANFYFDEITTNFGDASKTATRWAGILHMKGWKDDYAAWELAGNAHNTSLNDTLKYRQGKGTTWGEWQTIITNTNFTTYLNDAYVNVSGDTMTGPLIINYTTDANGTANNGPALVVGGTRTTAHIEIDNNEVMAKKDGTTTDSLYLNNDGGKVYVGSGGLQVNSMLTISNDNYTESRIHFTRKSYNYFTTNTSGSFCFIANGKTQDVPYGELVISNNKVYPGTTDLVSLGSAANQWDQTFTKSMVVDNNVAITYISSSDTLEISFI